MHLICSQQFDVARIEWLFGLANQIDRMSLQERREILVGKVMASLFYEPSTRTRLSFESAMLRLGGHVISTENAREFSSAIKGESLEDSIRVIGTYADVIVLRHNEIGSAERAAKVSPVPVINAGDGAGQHPTQALLDLYTIKREIGRTNNLNVVMVGDLKYGRTVRSLCYLLGKYEGNNITFVSPPQLRIGEDILHYLEKHNVAVREEKILIHHVVANADVIYQTRVQNERLMEAGGASTPTIVNVQRNMITRDKVEAMQPHAIIMHPLPRNSEISTEVDCLPQAKYFEQARYGLLVRMAILQQMLHQLSR